MFKIPSFFKKKYIWFLLLAVIVFPVTPLLFNLFLFLKEPVFLPPISQSTQIIIRSDGYGEGYFGARRSGGKRAHNGLDIKADVGEPVYASKSGFARTGWVKTGMGKYVIINHPWGYQTLYGHLNTITIADRQWVWQGRQIGEVGKTGNANYKRMQAHLHFEIRLHNRHLDPLEFLQPGQFVPFFQPQLFLRSIIGQKKSE